MKVSGVSSPPRNGAAPSSYEPSRRDRFSLTGPSLRLDLRVNAVRRDIADVALASQVFAPHYARPLLHACIQPHVPMYAAPSTAGVAVSELIFGETFAVVDASGDWAWGYGSHDRYVGFVPVDALGVATETSHIVDSPAALSFREADIKSPVVARLPMGARLSGTEVQGFLRTDDGFFHLRHVTRRERHDRDPVAIAERLTGTPYRWGGRSGDGIDCSGLVQLAFALCGVALPRDSDQQRMMGDAIPDDAPLMRGDLLFLPGHVAMVADAETIVHANAHWMATVREPLAAMIARQPGGQSIIARRRLTW